MAHIVVGTAGHIDHGKTSLVRALTGMDTDSLKEEQRRHITIDLGFAFLGDDVTIIDVPGHERFIKNMVSGVSTIDFVILVIAADDGIMPQTREHLDILRLLQVRRGIVALTKTSLVDPEWLELVREDVQQFLRGTFLENCPVVPVDSVTGKGLEEFRTRLLNELAGVSRHSSGGLFREFVDRVFTVRGHGTVITGTVVSGEVNSGDEVVILPTGRKTRVRGIQIHGRDVRRAVSGDRAALNLQGVTQEDLHRGMVISGEGVGAGSFILDVRLNLLESAPRLRDGTRVRLHIGTSEVMARVRLLGETAVAPGTGTWGQLTLEEKVAAVRGDLFVLRSYSPQNTIGGGRVLNPLPPGKRRKTERQLALLRQLEQEELDAAFTAIMKSESRLVWTVEDFVRRTAATAEEAGEVLARLIRRKTVVPIPQGQGKDYLLGTEMEKLEKDIQHTLEEFHRRQPDMEGMNLSSLQGALKPPPPRNVFDFVVQILEKRHILKTSGAMASLYDHEIKVDPARERDGKKLLTWISAQGNVLPRQVDLEKQFAEWSSTRLKDLLGLLIQQRLLFRVNREYVIAATTLKEIQEKLQRVLGGTDGLTISEIGEHLGTPRRITVPLMEYLDNIKFTYRAENRRLLN